MRGRLSSLQDSNAILDGDARQQPMTTSDAQVLVLVALIARQVQLIQTLMSLAGVSARIDEGQEDWVAG